MENLKKNPLSLQLNVEDFAPASNDEKKSLVVMRESVNFWKDGMRRLRKNKIAMVSLVVQVFQQLHRQRSDSLYFDLIIALFVRS